MQMRNVNWISITIAIEKCIRKFQEKQFELDLLKNENEAFYTS